VADGNHVIEAVVGFLLGEDGWIEHHELVVAEEFDEPSAVGLPGRADRQARGGDNIQLRLGHAASSCLNEVV